MKQTFVFVRPPRPLWPFNSPSSAFWPPLAFASMAAALREKATDIEVQILDAPALKMGWRSLESELNKRNPAFVGIGEEAVSCVEGLRLAHLAKQLGAVVIAGGCFFGNVAEEVLRTGLVDVVVHGEGEETVVALVRTLLDSGRNRLSGVHGISYSEGGAIIKTPPRALIKNLDRLPMPAYDLLPVSRYGAASANHPQFACIELGRGCFGSCNFCVLWRQMGRHAGDVVVPQLRVKSPERALAEVRLLVGRFGRRYLGWVDPCFNAHPEVPGSLSELMLKENLRVGQSAWMRTDGIVRDNGSGALDSCVRSGLNEVYLGIERPTGQDLALLHKTTATDGAREACHILRERFPEVLRIGSFIYGLPGDSSDAVRALHRFTFELGLDAFFLIPLTPLPGTAFWDPTLWDETGERFRQFGFLPTGGIDGDFGPLERAFLWSVLFNWPPSRIRAWGESLFRAPARRRRAHLRLQLRSGVFHLKRLVSLALGTDKYSGMIFPRWYET